jgi:hypothetical protein
MLKSMATAAALAVAAMLLPQSAGAGALSAPAGLAAAIPGATPVHYRFWGPPRHHWGFRHHWGPPRYHWGFRQHWGPPRHHWGFRGGPRWHFARPHGGRGYW